MEQDPEELLFVKTIDKAIKGKIILLREMVFMRKIFFIFAALIFVCLLCSCIQEIDQTWSAENVTYGTYSDSSGNLRIEIVHNYWDGKYNGGYIDITYDDGNGQISFFYHFDEPEHYGNMGRNGELGTQIYLKKDYGTAEMWVSANPGSCDPLFFYGDLAWINNYLRETPVSREGSLDGYDGYFTPDWAQGQWISLTFAAISDVTNCSPSLQIGRAYAKKDNYKMEFEKDSFSWVLIKTVYGNTHQVQWTVSKGNNGFITKTDQTSGIVTTYAN
ncbi:MAG: hypothetical protein II903_03205, partial [Spirochaetales bacterium]|nr:hypothetical protein [Spirochaetales bacterium]